MLFELLIAAAAPPVQAAPVAGADYCRMDRDLARSIMRRHQEGRSRAWMIERATVDGKIAPSVQRIVDGALAFPVSSIAAVREAAVADFADMSWLDCHARLPASGAEDGTPRVLEGRCEYPLETGTPGPNEVRVGCDGAVLATTSTTGGRMIRFTDGANHPVTLVGQVDPVDPGRWLLSRGYGAPGRLSPIADGYCRFFRRDDRPSAILCLFVADGRKVMVGYRAYVP